MARSLVGLSMVGLVAACVLCLGGVASAEPLSMDSLTKPVGEGPQQIPEVVEALQRLANRDINGAYESLKNASKKNPELPPAEVLMADFFARARQDAVARGWLERAVQESPQDPQAYVMLGQDAMQANRTTEAGLLLEKANQLAALFAGDAKRKESLQAASLSLLARLAMSQDHWAKAQGHLDLLLKMQPSDPVALQMLAQVLFEQKKPGEALEKLKAAKAANNNVLTPEATLAQWFEQAGNHAKAGDYMVAALNAQPKDFATRLAAAEWAMNTKDFTQARQQIDIALGIEPNSFQANFLAGGIAIFQKDYPAAEKYLKTALDLSPSHFGASNNLTVALIEQDNEAKHRLALQYAQVNARLYPNEAEPFSTLGRVLFRLGQYGEAEQALNKAGNLGRNSGKGISPDTGYYIADLYAKTNRKDEAKKILQEALKATGLFALRQEAEALQQQLSK